VRLKYAKRRLAALILLFALIIFAIFNLARCAAGDKQKEAQQPEDLVQNGHYTDEANAVGNVAAEKPTPFNITEPFSKDGVIVVNKKHPLPSSYAPGENAEAANHLTDLIQDAKVSGDPWARKIALTWSGYRAFADQGDIFNKYSSLEGEAQTETYSARAGYSEHQTGLAFDLMVGNGLYRESDSSYDFGTDWVAQNAENYGFIVRYRDAWQDTTGYIGEPWHLRYLGVDLAKKVKNSGKSLEEYLGVSGGEY
jgi:D-alanyl-D-alanine carboxypeptidase